MRKLKSPPLELMNLMLPLPMLIILGKKEKKYKMLRIIPSKIMVQLGLRIQFKMNKIWANHKGHRINKLQGLRWSTEESSFENNKKRKKSSKENKLSIIFLKSRKRNDKSKNRNSKNKKEFKNRKEESKNSATESLLSNKKRRRRNSMINGRECSRSKHRAKPKRVHKCNRWENRRH